MEGTLSRRLRLLLTLLGGFAFGMHAAVLMHELGHALGYWVAGGTVRRIVMQAPLPFGYVVGSAADPRPSTWGGVLFGTLFSAAPLLLARRLPWSSTARLGLLFFAAFSLGHNATYLVVGGLHPFADAAGMVRLGTPPGVLLLVGIPLLAAFAGVLALALRSVGFRSRSPIAWIAGAEAGLLPFPAVMVLSLLFSPRPDPLKVPMVILLATYAGAFAAAALLAWRRSGRGPSGEVEEVGPRWGAAGAMWLAACAVVLLELALLHP